MKSLTYLKILAIGLLLVGAAPVDKTSARLDFSSLRTIPVQHDGRLMPLDTLAREKVKTVTGTEYFRNCDPVFLFLAWTFDPDTWKEKPLVSISNSQLRSMLRLPIKKTTFSYNELIHHEPLLVLMEQLCRIPPGKKADPLQVKVADIGEKLSTLEEIFQDQVIKPIPDDEDPEAPWQSISSLSSQYGTPLAESLKDDWTNLKKSFLARDYHAFKQTSVRLYAHLNALPAANRPNEKMLLLEIHYNQSRPFRLAWIVLIVSAAFAAAGLCIPSKGLSILTIFVQLTGLALLTYGLWLRGRIAGHIPASNMFESILFLSWGLAAFAILSSLIPSHRLVPLTASAMGALALFLADYLPIDHFIRPIVPVLRDTIWMSIHVPVIMISYSVLTLAVLIAHIQLAVLALVPRPIEWKKFADTLDYLHYWYVLVGSLLLWAGIITGSFWAASSWGRYWGWDPKEVWSLAALLGYLAILHVRIDHSRISPSALIANLVLPAGFFLLLVPKFVPLTSLKLFAFAALAAVMIFFVFAKGPFAAAIKSILAFWLIIMTYVGVNYVLGAGLHSYAFGTGDVVYYLFLAGMFDLLSVAFCSAVYLIRSAYAENIAARSR